jgi:hypothetical protein
MLPQNMPQDLARLMHMICGQVIAMPPRQKRSEFHSRLEELLLKRE